MTLCVVSTTSGSSPSSTSASLLISLKQILGDLRCMLDYDGEEGSVQVVGLKKGSDLWTMMEKLVDKAKK
jgi:hypothetical protein